MSQYYQAIPGSDLEGGENPAVGPDSPESLVPVAALTGEELEKCMLDHDIFMKSIDIVSKNEASFSALVPQFVILLNRLYALQHSTTEFYAMQFICVCMSDEIHQIPKTWETYSSLSAHLKRCQFPAGYEERLGILFEEARKDMNKSPNSYSLDEFRRRIYELKCDCVAVSYARYSAAKLKLWDKTETRDLRKTYVPLGFSLVAVCVSLFTLFLKVMYHM